MVLALLLSCRSERPPTRNDLQSAPPTPPPAAKDFAAPGESEIHGRFGPAPKGAVKQWSMGADHACALMDDGALECWSDARPTFPLSALPAGNYRSVQVGVFSTCGLRTDGTALCVGSSLVTTPPGDQIVELCHAVAPCVIRSDGTAACFEEGQTLSLGRVRPGSLACGAAWSCALALDGTPRCVVIDRVLAFGNEYAQPAAWKLPPGSFRRVFSGYQHGCALRMDQSAICWGRDTSGETRPPPGAFATLALGEKLSCGLRPRGSVECWGSEPGPPHAGPYVELDVTKDRDALNSVCAVRPDRRVECWDYGH